MKWKWVLGLECTQNWQEDEDEVDHLEKQELVIPLDFHKQDELE